VSRRIRSEMENEVHIGLAKRTDLTSSIRGQIFDSAYLYVASAIRHSELETSAGATLAAGAGEIPVPTDIWFPEIVYNSTDNRRIYPGELDAIQGQSKPTGLPSKYVRWGNSFLVDRMPAADTTITTYYTKMPAILAAGENSVLDMLYDQLIIMFAIKFAMEGLRDFEQAAKMQTAINVYGGQIKIPWRMTKTDDRDARIRVQLR
jgi:hypothetical protein